jgi:hypothetical protein
MFPLSSHFFSTFVWAWFNFHLHKLWSKGAGKQREAWQNNVFLNFEDATILSFYVGDCPHAPKNYSWVNQMFPYKEKEK